MKSIASLLIIFALFNPAPAQLLEKPLFPFEQLNWGMKLGDVPSVLIGKKLRPLDSNSHPAAGTGSATFQHFYLDTMYAVRIAVSLQFSKVDSILQSVIVASLSIDTLSGNSKKDDLTIDRFRQQYSERLGKPAKEKSIPFIGNMSLWALQKTAVQMVQVSSISLVTFTFTPKSAGE